MILENYTTMEPINENICNFFNHIDKNDKNYHTIRPTGKYLSEKNRFRCGAEGLIFEDADPITEEYRLEADRLWNPMVQPGTSPGKR
ncbi:hypothetical protein ACSAZL_00840 [Methanosarcina sp. T3]|uniref:hypothetical protein n=1 Tax=Methanosarcina sp. T3 TaxID=3439062 RepID=UPI003F82EFA6